MIKQKQVVVTAMTCLVALMNYDTNAEVFNLDDAHRFFNEGKEGVRKDSIHLEHANFLSSSEEIETASQSLDKYKQIMACADFFATSDPNIASICRYLEIFLTEGKSEASEWLSQHKGRSNPFAPIFSAAINENEERVRDVLNTFVARNADFRYLWSSCGTDGGIGAAIITTVVPKNVGEQLQETLNQIRGDKK